MVYTRPSAWPSRCASPTPPRHRAPARRGPRRAARPSGAVLGRSRECRRRASTTRTSRAATPRCGPSGGSWIVRDLGSTNGVKVNGRRIEGPQSLRPRRRDRARAPPAHLRAGVAHGPRPRRRRASSSASSPSSTCSCSGWRARRCKDLRRGAARRRAGLRGRDRHAPAGAGLDARRDRGGAPAAGRRRAPACAPAPPTTSRDGALLGRGDEADIRLEDTFASTRHARLVPQGDVVVLEDWLDQRDLPQRRAAARPAAAARRATASASATPSSPSSDWTDVLRVAEQWYESDVGRQRQGNEDNFFVRSPLFVVADGMGGAQAGEVASRDGGRGVRRRAARRRRRPRSLVARHPRGQPRASTTARAADAARAGMGTT